MKIQMILLDLDGTVLNSRGELTKATRDAIDEAIRSGIEVVVASGRPYASLPHEILQMDKIRYKVTSNGAAIYEGEQRIRSFLLPGDAVDKILSLLSGESVVYECFVEGEAFADERFVKDPVAFGADAMAIPYIQRTRRPVPDMEGFLREHREELDSLDVIVRSEEQKQRIIELLQEKRLEIYITTSVTHLVEISNRQGGKHSALSFLSKYLSIPICECAACGDALNDVEMVREAGLGIAVQNAIMECKQAADHITESNDEDGIAKAIMRILRQEL